MGGSKGCRILKGGIFAAGEGSRLRADGYRGSKAMVRVAGEPLIGHALARFRAVGIREVSVILNDASEDCQEWLARHGDNFELDLVLRTTPSSYASFRIVAERTSGAPTLITTVDGIMPIGDFSAFVESASAFPKTAVVLGLTAHVDDEKPLWASLDPADGRIRRIGEGAGPYVTAGLYLLPVARPPEPDRDFARLRDYLGWLVAAGHPVYGIVLPRVFDIDSARDVAAAERAVRA